MSWCWRTTSQSLEFTLLLQSSEAKKRLQETGEFPPVHPEGRQPHCGSVTTDKAGQHLAHPAKTCQNLWQRIFSLLCLPFFVSWEDPSKTLLYPSLQNNYMEFLPSLGWAILRTLWSYSTEYFAPLVLNGYLNNCTTGFVSKDWAEPHRFPLSSLTVSTPWVKGPSFLNLISIWRKFFLPSPRVLCPVLRCPLWWFPCGLYSRQGKDN